MTATLSIGLTGGLASGKSTVGGLFGNLGVSVIDADQVARDVVAPGSAALQAIVEQFGPSIIHNDGALDRHRLREIVFACDERRRALEGIVHPTIRQEMERRLNEIDAPYAISMIPLLFESGQGKRFERILVVDAALSRQLERAKARDGSTADTLRGIVDAQLDRDARLAQADDVIHNDGGIQALRPQVERLHEHYLSLASRLRVDQHQ